MADRALLHGGSDSEQTWRCTGCGTEYTADVGTCGQNLPYQCRERVKLVELTPELDRLQRGITLLTELREVFNAMGDDGERERAWRYLASRFGEFENSEMPAWEVVEAEEIPA